MAWSNDQRDHEHWTEKERGWKEARSAPYQSGGGMGWLLVLLPLAIILMVGIVGAPPEGWQFDTRMGAVMFALFSLLAIYSNWMLLPLLVVAVLHFLPLAGAEGGMALGGHFVPILLLIVPFVGRMLNRNE